MENISTFVGQCKGEKVFLALSDQTLPSIMLCPPTSSLLPPHTHTNCSQPALNMSHLDLFFGRPGISPLAMCPHMSSASRGCFKSTRGRGRTVTRMSYS